MARAAAPTGRAPALRLRTASEPDAGACAGLLGELGYPCTAAEAATRIATLRDDPAQRLRLAVDAGDRVLGLAHAAIRTTLESGRHAELLTLVVREAVRGQGVGGHLLADVEHWASASGLPLWLRSRITREHAHAFYEQRGWRRIKTQHVFRRDGTVVSET